MTALRVQLIAKPNASMTGTQRYSENLYRGLCAAGVEATLTTPEPVKSWGWLKRLGLNATAFFASYPLRVKTLETDVYHITSQTMATLLMFQKFNRPIVVTVLDIIPYLVRHDPKLNSFRHPVDYWFYRLALMGLKHADALIAISEYTKRTLVEALGLPAKKIHVVYPAVDHEVFRPLPVPETFRTQYQLSLDTRYVLYVGSNDPRKNLRVLVSAFAQVKNHFKNIVLLLVGSDAFPHEQQALQSLITQLGLQHAVRWVTYVPEADLPLFYNLAEACVLPSLYEGFGLPLLEALACGKPVLCANTTALPEIAGEATTLFAPDDVRGLATGLNNRLTQPHSPAQQLAAKTQAMRFNWEQTAHQTLAVYNLFN